MDLPTVSVWFGYEMFPIDIYWEWLPTDSEFAAKLDLEDRIVFYSALAEALRLGKRIGWEGDFRHDLHVLVLPGDTYFRFGFVWKQDNNGTTYVVSPVKLPHLDEHCITRWPLAEYA